MVRANRVGGSTPSYKHCLSFLGQYLNQNHARWATIAEVDTGFMVHYFLEGNITKPRTLLVSFSDLLELSGEFARAANGRKGGILRGGTNHDKKHQLLPQGYETSLTALGTKFDQRDASNVTICEAPNMIYVDYWITNATFVVRDQRRQAVSNHMQETYDSNGLQRLYDTVRLSIEQDLNRYTSSLRLNKHDYISGMQLALMLEDGGNYAGAEDTMARIAAQVPEHAEAQYHLARLAYVRREKRLALQAIKRAVGLRPDIAAIQDLHGRVLQLHGKHADALAAFEQAVGIDPDNALLHDRLSRAYATQGRTADAAYEMAFVTSAHAARAWDAAPEHPQEEQAVAVPSAVPEEPAAPPVPEPALVAAALTQTPPPSPGFGTPSDFDPAWIAPMTGGEASFAAGLRSIEAQIAPGAPSMTTSFDTVAPLSWTQPEAGLPALVPTGEPAGGADQAERSRPEPEPGEVDSLGAASLSQRLRTGGPTAARQPSSERFTEFSGAAAGFTSMEGQQAGTAFEPAAPAAESWGMSGSFEAMPTLRSLSEPAPGTPTASEAPIAPAPRLTPSAQQSPSQFDVQTPVPIRGGTPPGGFAPEMPTTASMAAPAPPPAHLDLDAQGAVEIAAEILTIQRALESEPNRADLHRKLGFLLARQGRAAEAAAEFRRALQCSRMNL